MFPLQKKLKLLNFIFKILVSTHPNEIVNYSYVEKLVQKFTDAEPVSNVTLQPTTTRHQK